MVGIRVTDNAGEVAKYITKPGAYLNLDGNGAWWCDPDRLETVHTIPVFLCRSSTTVAVISSTAGFTPVARQSKS